MVTQIRRGGCGCCGCLFAFFLLLFALILVGLGLFYFSATNNVRRFAAAGPVPSNAAAVNRQTYAAARQKFNRFFADPAVPNLTLSNAEVNALLTDSPELGILRRGTVVVLNQNSAEVSGSLPVDLPLLPRRYLNWAFQVRMAMRGKELDLDVSRIERDGKPLAAAETQQYQFVVVPLTEKLLSGLNQFQGNRSVHEVRIENGNLFLAR
jgi:hypothetical protein